DQVIEAVAPDRDRSHDALFQTALIVQNPPRDVAQGSGLQMTPLLVDNGTAKYDLTLFFWEEAGGWVGQIEYRTSLFKPETVARFLTTFETLLDDALANPSTGVSRLALLDDGQRQELDRFNESQLIIDEPRLIHQRIGRWMTETPHAAAVRVAGSMLSYGDLDTRSAAVVSALQNAGAGVDDAVVVCLPRSIDSIVAMLGVWRAGCVYVPVDAELAPQRLAFVAEDAGAKIVIGSSELAPPPGCRVLTLDDALKNGSPGAPAVRLEPDARAYVIYTSGSTGTPKGVECEHRGIVGFITAQTEIMQPRPSDRLLHTLSPSFDGGLAEVLLALANGATCVIARREETLDPAQLTRVLQEGQVNIAKFTPALLATLDPAELPGLQTVLSAGDKLTGELARRWLAGRKFFNGYGPTEATVGAAMYPLPAATDDDDVTPAGPPPIGAPMGNVRVHVLDRHRQRVPIGVTGELYVAGPGIARGYLNQPEQTAEKFLADPFASSDEQSPRMYRTGDLGRWRADGVLEFRGRVDDQVQLRGYRVEPGEVTSALEALPEIGQAFVCVRADSVGEDRLVAYVVPASDQETTASDQHLASWQALMNQTHKNAGVLRNPEFDITGWVSTFTGRPIPADEMQQWVDSTVRRVRSLQPQDVLEIGCGSGLILLGVAPGCRSYVGTDFLARSIDQLRGVLDQRSDPWTEHVELIEMAAHDVAAGGPLQGRKFDTIVMNSVVQYFPNIEYLIGVLRQASGLLAPGGAIFLGDLRNLRLQEAMAAAVEISRAGEGLSRRELLGRIENRVRHEEELLLAPELFETLRQELPRLTGVEVQLKEGPADNELTRYRYDAVLRFDTAAPRAPEAPESLNAKPRDANEGIELSEVIHQVADEKPDQLIVKNLPNPRVANDVQAWRRLREADGDAIVAELREGSRQPTPTTGIDPERWRAALRDHPGLADYRAEVRWSAADAPDRYDVVIRRVTAGDPASSSPVGADQDKNQPDWRSLANRPTEEKRLSSLAPRLRTALAERLPQYMIPSAFVLLDRLPRTVQGKIDRNALPPPTGGRPAWTSGYVAPDNDDQRLVAQVWEDLLGVSPVGAEDDFFELGGHSMLAVRVMAEIEARSGAAVPLAALFQQPTVRHVAAMLSDPSAAETSSLIELTKPPASAAALPPLFCIHPAGGTVFCYQALAEHFACERPVIGVQAVGVDGLRPPHDTMEEMADHYAKLMRQRWPAGPYHVCGWSLGGNIAYAVASALVASGAEVGFVGLFDAGATPPAESLSESDLAPLLTALFPNLEHLPLEELRRLSPEDQVAYFTERATQAGLVDAAQLAASKHVYSVFQKNVEAVHRHATAPFPGRVTLFRAAEQAETNELSANPTLGWGGLVGAVDVFSIASNHAQMMSPPHVDKLARLVREAIDADLGA
ncbi:MAG: amino acid adenylation domain-containing protein, partial [Planctomycetota bacterium]